MTYVVVGCKPWNRRTYEQSIRTLPGDWHFVSTKEELEIGLLRELRPRYVFFLHWSWRVPTDILTEFECICFHMTDVPYGRGGSPLQNLILRGHTDTVLTALRMTDEIDAGPVYLKCPLSLSGTAEAIYLRATELSLHLAAEIAGATLAPVPQEGAPTHFTRRTPAESALPGDATLDEVVDFIRMLDADGYPRAFVDHGELRVELRAATRYADRVEARVVITRREVSR